MPSNRMRPYNELPLLPPQSELETREVLKRAIAAARSLAELKEAGSLIPNQAVLVNTIPVLEAQAGSEIENVVTTTDKLFQLASDENAAADPATKEAYRYRTALCEGFVSLRTRPLSTRTAVDVCRTIRGVDVGIRAVPGTAIANPYTREIAYTPPEGPSLLANLLANWEQYAHVEDDIDPLIRMAVLHYQFEAIHPFADGNGRTGRVLNILFLIEKGLLDIPVLYLSRHILAHRGEYYRLLRGITENQEWQEWILFMLTAIDETASWTSRRIREIRRLLRNTRDYVRQELPAIYSRELVELLFVQPYVRISNVVDARIAKRQAASNYLHRLCEIGVLREAKFGRDKLFIHPKFLDLLLRDAETFEEYPVRPGKGLDRRRRGTAPAKNSEGTQR